MTSHSGLVVARPGLVRDGLQAVLAAIPGMAALEPANDGKTALERLKNRRPDLVILDSSLSQEELYTTLGKIKEMWPDVRCIVIVANPQHQGMIGAAGADAVLVEGFPAPLLPTTIRVLMARTSAGALSERGEPDLDQPPGERPEEIQRKQGGV